MANSRRTLYYSWPVVVVLCLVFIFLVQGYFREFKQQQEVKKEIQSLKDKQTSFAKVNTQLEENLAFLGTQSYKAKVARNLNMKKEGEEVVIFPENFKALRNPPLVAEPKQESNIKKWWDYFFNTSNQRP